MKTNIGRGYVIQGVGPGIRASRLVRARRNAELSAEIQRLTKLAVSKDIIATEEAVEL